MERESERYDILWCVCVHGYIPILREKTNRTPSFSVILKDLYKAKKQNSVCVLMLIAMPDAKSQSKMRKYARI